MGNSEQIFDRWLSLYLERDGSSEEEYGQIIDANNSLIESINKGAACNSSRLYTEAVKVLSIGIDVGEQLRSDNNLISEGELAKAHINRGVAYEYLGKHSNALCDKIKSVEMLEELRSNGDLYDENLLAMAYMNRGATYVSMGKYVMAIDDYKKAIDILDYLKEHGEDVSDDYAQVLANINIAKTKMKTSKATQSEILDEETDLGLDEIDQAIKVAEEQDNRTTLACLYTIRGMGCFQLNEYIKAISNFDNAIEIMENIHKAGGQFDENELAKAYAGRGLAFYPLGESNKATNDLNRCVEIWERLQSENKYIDESLLLQIYALQAGVLNTTSEDADEAIWDVQKSIEIAKRRQATGEDINMSALAKNYSIMAVSYDQKESYEEANENYSKCIEILEDLLDAGEKIDKDNLATAYMNRASNYYHEFEEIDKALSDYNKAVHIREQLCKEGVQQDAFDLFMLYKNRSQAYEADDDVEAAIKDVIIAMQILKESFSTRLEFQTIYYDVLEEIIELIEEIDNKVLLQKTLQDFLYSMRQVPKIPEAENAQNNILRKLK